MGVPGGGLPTATVAEEDVVPPGPVHWRVKVVSAPIPPVYPLPMSVPELVHGPIAVQLVALAELHARRDCPPYGTEVGVAVMLTVGAGAPGVTGGVHELEFWLQAPLVQV